MKGKKKLQKLQKCTNKRAEGLKVNQSSRPKGGHKPGTNSGVTRPPKGTGTNRY